MDNQTQAPSDQDQLAADIAANTPAQSPIAQFKAQYPAYKDVPDVQLADALHQKFYSDVPRDAFMVMSGLADAGGAMSTSMGRDAYQKRFLADNPQAGQGQLDAVMAQYDQQAAARAKALASAPSADDAAAAKAKALAAMSPEQIVAQDFNDRLDNRLRAGAHKDVAGHQDVSGSILPGYTPDTTDYSYHAPTLFDKTAGNFMGGMLGTLIGADASFNRLIGDGQAADEADAARQQITADQNKRLGGNTFTGKVSNLVGGVVPAMGIPEGALEQAIGNAGLFAVPAFQDTYKAKLAAGESKTAALAHAAEAFGINMLAPTVMQKGFGAVLGKAAEAPTLGGAALGLGQAAAEGVGFSAANSILDKGTDAAFGYKNDRPWLDPEDMAVQAAGFGGMRAAHLGVNVGLGGIDAVRQAQQQQALLDQIAKAGNVDDAIAAASAAVSTPASGFTADVLQTLRPLESGPMSWKDAMAPDPAAMAPDQGAAQLGQKYVRVTKPDGSTGFAAVPADPTAPEGGAPAQLGAQYIRITKADGSTAMVPVDDLASAPGGTQAQLGAQYSRVTHPDGSTGFTAPPTVWRRGDDPSIPTLTDVIGHGVWKRANDPTIPTLTDRVDHLRTDIPTLTDQLAGPDGIPTLTDELPGQAPIPTLTDVLSRPAGEGWSTFPHESGTLGIPRADMPQIRAEHRGALVNFLNARGIPHEHVELPADGLKPTQAEFSMEKVNKAHAHQDGERSILTSSDGHILDGHHQWLAKLEKDEPVKAIRLGAPIRNLLDTVREFPSVEQSPGAPGNHLESKAVEPGTGMLDTGAAPDRAPTHLDLARAKHERQDELVRQAQAKYDARKGAAAPTGDPMLDKPASWVIRNKKTGDVVAETFDRNKVDALNTEKYEAVPIAQHLREINDPSSRAGGLARGDAWHGSEHAPRIDKMLGDLRAAGLHDHADMMDNGLRHDAKHGQLDEKAVAFREENARQTIANKAREAGDITPAEIKPMTGDRMHEVADTANALPQQILDAAAKKWNPIAEQLAAMGFKFGEPHAGSPIEARRLQRQLQDIVHALLGLAPRRYMAAKGHKNADPKKLKRAEEFASQQLGIKTTRYPGVDTSNPITLGRGIVSAEERSQAGRQQAQRMRDRLKESNPFLHLIADHGVSVKDRADLGVEKGPAANPPVPGFGPVIRKNGKRLDELALHARDAGFLTDHDIEATDDTGGTRKMAEMIRRALASKDVIKTPDMMEADLPSQDENLQEEAARLGIDAQGKSADQLYDEVAAAHRAEDDQRGEIGADTASKQTLAEDYADHFEPDEVAAAGDLDADIPFDLNDPRAVHGGDLTDEEIDAKFGLKNQGARETGAETQADPGADAGDRAARAAAPGEGEEGLLTPYSRDDVLQRQQADETAGKQRQAERDRLEQMRRKQQDDADVRARLDASADNFQLGQDAHDSLAGQGDIFSQPAPEPTGWKGDDKARVIKALEPGQYGGRLTPERLGAILGGSDSAPGTTIGTRRAQEVLDQLEREGKVERAPGRESYQLTSGKKAEARPSANPIAEQLRRQDPHVFSQGRVHAYDPENARPLLLIACSDAKLEGTHPAGELYQGGLFDMLRKWMPTKNPPAVYVISAKHGLVHVTDPIESYNEKMTEDRARELMLRPVDSREFRTQDFSQVYVAGGKLYRDVGQVYAERLKNMGVLAPDAEVQGAADGDGVGKIRGHLGDYLRHLDENAPAGAADLAAKNDEHYQSVKLADAEAIANLHDQLAKPGRADYLTLRDGGSIAVGDSTVRLAKDEKGWAFHVDDGSGKVERLEVKPASKENTAKAAADYVEQLRHPPEQVPDLGGMFDQILAEEMKAKPAEDLGDMFDAILADETQKAEQAKALQQIEQLKTPGTNVEWSTLKDWVDGWNTIDQRAATAKRYQQLDSHLAELAKRPELINSEKDPETLAKAKALMENLQPGRGQREGHSTTELLQRLGTQLAKAKVEGLRKPKAEPLAEGIPLSFLKRLNVDHNSYDHQAGKWDTKNMPADKALRSVRDDISSLEAMLKCMKG